MFRKNGFNSLVFNVVEEANGKKILWISSFVFACLISFAVSVGLGSLTLQLGFAPPLIGVAVFVISYFLLARACDRGRALQE
jgi:hypothetical protein